MPYIITKKNGKRWDWPSWARPFPSNVVGEYARDGKAVGDCWTLTNVVTRRTINVGACKRPTPESQWDGAGGFFEKLFGKKKSKRNPMSRRIYMIKTPSGRLIPAGPAAMGRARRRRRHRR